MIELCWGTSRETTKLLEQSIGPNGIISSQYDDDPGLNSIIYNVEFPNGSIKEYSTNVISENTLTQVDDDGFTMKMM